VLRILAAAVLAALTVGVATAPAGGGNSAAADLCQKDGWRTWSTTGGGAFANQGACVSYAAHGGLLATFTTSTTSHETRTRVDLPAITLYSTRIIGLSTLSGTHHDYTNKLVYDSTVPAEPSSAEVGNAFDSARAAIATDLSVADHGQILFAGPVLTDQSESSSTVSVGDVVNHVETTTPTTTTSTGPVTVNINTNTHTETFVDEQYQTTVHKDSVYVISGSVTVS
jgi:hypothetical protein